LDSGALIKEYEAEEKETEQVAQLAITGVESEDPRFLEKDAPPLHEEFPAGSKIIFLGEHGYGVAAQVSETTETTLSVILAVSHCCRLVHRVTLILLLISTSLTTVLRTRSLRQSSLPGLLVDTCHPIASRICSGCLLWPYRG
jgi:Exoribonuclease Xrn1 D2/D3 domain/Exoribonuclease Xrn1 D1 domain